MAAIKMVRVDYRLIHGQVITKWVKQANASQIIIINDELSKDPFMSSIYTMAAPPQIKVYVYSKEQAVQLYKENEFGSGNAFLLFRNVQDAKECLERGIVYPALNIGGIASEPGKKMIVGQVYLSKQEYGDLAEIYASGVKIDVQVLPNETRIQFSDIKM